MWGGEEGGKKADVCLNKGVGLTVHIPRTIQDLLKLSTLPLETYLA